MRLTTLVSALLLGLTSALQGAVTFSIQEIGSDVVFTGSGTIDLEGLGAPASAGWSGSVSPSNAWAIVGAGGDADVYTVSVFPTNIGSGGTTFADANTGDLFGVFKSHLYVPQDYISGSSLLGTSTFSGQSLASLGLTEGVYTWSWGSGGNADSATLTISAVPEPGTWALAAGIVSLGFVGLKRYRKVRGAVSKA